MRTSVLARLSCALVATLMLGACSTVGGPATGGWQEVRIPGKEPTRYTLTREEGRPTVRALAEQSASLWRQPLPDGAPQPSAVSFSWRVLQMPTGASVADVSREDAAARVLLAFDGDTSRLPARTRAMFDLAEALTGERPPYATLMYVWCATNPVGTVIVNPRSDRIRKIVVDSGPAEVGRWREHRRDLRADFLLAFGEDPGPLRSVAVMADADNTRSRALSWFGPVQLH